jgi:enamine deaminase RidA (YjgF/YER057c/UK114 family)
VRKTARSQKKEARTMAHIRKNPASVAQPTGYTHVVEAQGSRTIYISGQTPVNAAGEVVGEGDLAKQAEQVFENLKACLAEAGATFADVTKTTTLVVNYQPEYRQVIAAARQKFYGDAAPASTLIGVQALARPEFMIEIEAVVVL